MNDSLKETLNEYLIQMLEGLEQGAMWVGEQIPLLVQELLLFNGVKHGVFILISALGLWLGAYIVLRGFKVLNNYKEAKHYYQTNAREKSSSEIREYIHKNYSVTTYYDGDPCCSYDESYYFIFGGLTTLSSLAFLVDNLITFLKITLAPRLYLLEYASELVK